MWEEWKDLFERDQAPSLKQDKSGSIHTYLIVETWKLKLPLPNSPKKFYLKKANYLMLWFNFIIKLKCKHNKEFYWIVTGQELECTLLSFPCNFKLISSSGYQAWLGKALQRYALLTVLSLRLNFEGNISSIFIDWLIDFYLLK